MEPYIVQPRSEKGFGLCAFASADSYYPFSCTKRCVDNTTLYSYCPPIYVASRINHIYSNSQWDANWNSMTLLSDNSIDDRYSYSLHVSVTRTYDLDDISGCPLNPVHRCGIRGYGELPMLGPNHCNCLIICNDKAEICMMRQMSLKQSIYRVLPKAFASRITDNKLVQDVLHNQNILPMAIRQAWLKAKPNIESSLDTLFTFQNHVQAVEAGYLDHPLNTDNAWIELFVWKVKCNKELEISIADQNLSDSADFVWIPIDNISELLIPEFDRNLITLYFN
ncbi:hypothetical protein GJ496_005282 [Pomphorhynchus laevis]|nr:hypothetical protein GJ496_005282 [Pomphorhynchus laevis]